VKVSLHLGRVIPNSVEKLEVGGGMCAISKAVDDIGDGIAWLVA